MKKIILIAAFIVSTFAFASCTPEQIDGFNQGMYCQDNGFRFIGYYDTSECSAACDELGYDYFCTGENTVWCGCK